MDKKTIIVGPVIDAYDEYEAEAHVETIVCDNVVDLVRNMLQEIAESPAAIRLLIDDNNFSKELEKQGFTNVAKLKRVAANSTPVKRFWMWDTAISYARPQQIDLEKVPTWKTDDIASDKVLLLQEIRKSSLRKTCPTAYRAMLASKKKLKAQQDKNKVAAKKRAETKKQKKIAKAKKLLAEAGESV